MLHRTLVTATTAAVLCILAAMPARVALVSFYVWDCGNKKESSYSIYGGNVVYRTTNIQKRSVDSGDIDVLATILLKTSIGTLKESLVSSWSEAHWVRFSEACRKSRRGMCGSGAHRWATS